MVAAGAAAERRNMMDDYGDLVTKVMLNEVRRQRQSRGLTTTGRYLRWVRYRCPKHKCPLIPRSCPLTNRQGEPTGEWLEYFACPRHKCAFIKANKWQKKKVKP